MKEFSKSIPGENDYSIESYSWKDDYLVLIGANWKFATGSAWRLSKDGEIIALSQTCDGIDQLKCLIQLKIVRIEAQSVTCPVDPCFHLKNGYILEVFSSDTYEPWEFTAMDGRIFLGMS
jgi:hypothetical protein